MKKGRRVYTLIAITVIISVLCSTVGVSAASGKYGTYDGTTYYYTTTTVEEGIRYEFPAEKPTKKQLNKWKKTIADLVLSLMTNNLTVPFSLVEDMIGEDAAKISYGTTYSYAVKGNLVQRSIYKYTDKEKTKKKVLLKDQKIKADAFYCIYPAGTGFDKDQYSKKMESKKIYTTKYYNSKDRNLQRCKLNANHNTCEYWYVSHEIISTYWK